MKIKGSLSIYFTLILGISFAQDITEPHTQWATIDTDTFPNNINYDNTLKTAQTHLYEWSRMNPHSDQNHALLLNTVIYFCLAKDFTSAQNIIEEQKKSNYPYINELIASKLFIEWSACYSEKNSEQCLHEKNSILQFLDSNIITSNINEAIKWHWIQQLLQNNSSKSHPLLKHTTQLSENDNLPTYKGAILAVQRAPSKNNLLISDGHLQPLRMYELNSKGKWMNVTKQAGLADIPGGERIYAVDINHDGLQDIIVLRNPPLIYQKYFYPSVLILQKNGTYKDMSLEMGLDFAQRSICACFLDANLDGKMDIFLGNEKYNSKLLIQKEGFKFEDAAQNMGIITHNQKIVDCSVSKSIDGKDLLILSAYNFPNYLYEYSLLQGQYPFFIRINEAETSLSYPYKSGLLFENDINSDGSVDIIALTDHTQKYKDQIFSVLSGSKKMDELSTIYDFEKKDTIQLSPVLSFAQNAVFIDAGNSSPEMITSGGKDWDEFYPLCSYNLNDSKEKTYFLEYQPLYVNGMTITPPSKKSSPILWMKGGSISPALKGKMASYFILPQKGKYVNIQLVGKNEKEAIGSIITVYIKDEEGNTTTRTRKIQVMDSHGKGAGQNLWWLDDSSSILAIHVTWPEGSQQRIDKIKIKNGQITILEE